MAGFDDDDADRPPPEGGAFPRKLGPMSLEALERYIAALEAEIARCRGEIERKRRLRDAADSVFGPKP